MRRKHSATATQSATGWKLDASGQYSRQLGWKSGHSGQTKFRLGDDLTKAQLAAHKLAMLWDIVAGNHQRQQQAIVSQDSPVDSASPSRPVWTYESFTIAQAIGYHQHTLMVGRPGHIHDHAAYADYIDFLREQYGSLINIQPADTEAAFKGAQAHAHFADHRSRQARRNARIANIPIPTGLTGTSLHQMFDAYAADYEKNNHKESGKVEAGNARRLKDAIPDMDLGEFGISAMEQLKNYWVSRPVAKLRGGKSTGRPIGLTTVDNHLSTARRFVRWLDRLDTCTWELPRHGLEALKVNLKRLRTDAEVAGQRHGVKVFTVEQLAIIYKYATDFERLLLLLGLNAAMAQAEVTTLRWDELEVDPPTIKRIRRKSSVYAEFLLWPETTKALEWWQQVRPAQGELVMLTDKLAPYTRQRLSNAWNNLKGRIERETGQSVAWWLPFKHLRKTAAQFVREKSDGEIAGVFLSHGQPVASDALADHYSNRPFPKVAVALMEVHTALKPMFKAQPKAFGDDGLGRGPHRQKLAKH